MSSSSRNKELRTNSSNLRETAGSWRGSQAVECALYSICAGAIKQHLVHHLLRQQPVLLPARSLHRAHQSAGRRMHKVLQTNAAGGWTQRTMCAMPPKLSTATRNGSARRKASAQMHCSRYTLGASDSDSGDASAIMSSSGAVAAAKSDVIKWHSAHAINASRRAEGRISWANLRCVGVNASAWAASGLSSSL